MPFTITLPQPPMLPRALLLDQISRIPLGDATGERWMYDGVTWEPWDCERPLVWSDANPACQANPFDDEPFRTCLPAVTQTGFRIQDRFRASLPDYDATMIEELLARRFSTMSSWIFAKALTQDISGPESLPSTATAPSAIAFGSAATPLQNALAVLEEELSDRLMGEQGIIFLTPGLLAQAKTLYGVEWFDATSDDGPAGEGAGWQTPAGNRVIADGGFYAADAPTGSSASGAAEEWVYASGPVHYQSTMPSIQTARQAPGADRNEITGFIDSHGILVFEPCPVTAVLAAYDLS